MFTPYQLIPLCTCGNGAAQPSPAAPDKVSPLATLRHHFSQHYWRQSTQLRSSWTSLHSIFNSQAHSSLCQRSSDVLSMLTLSRTNPMSLFARTKFEFRHLCSAMKTVTLTLSIGSPREDHTFSLTPERLYEQRFRSSWGSHWRCEEYPMQKQEDHGKECDTTMVALFSVCKRV
jgi:hypothetical protein